MHRAPTLDASPQKIAIGLLGLGLVWSGLLPAVMLRPQPLDDDEWERLLLESQGINAMPSNILGPEHPLQLFDIYRVSIGPDCTPANLQQACGVAVNVMREIVSKAAQASQNAAQGQDGALRSSSV